MKDWTKKVLINVVALVIAGTFGSTFYDLMTYGYFDYEVALESLGWMTMFGACMLVLFWLVGHIVDDVRKVVNKIQAWREIRLKRRIRKEVEAAI